MPLINTCPIIYSLGKSPLLPSVVMLCWSSIIVVWWWSSSSCGGGPSWLSSVVVITVSWLHHGGMSSAVVAVTSWWYIIVCGHGCLIHCDGFGWVVLCANGHGHVQMDVDGHGWGWMTRMGIIDMAAVDCGWATVWCWCLQHCGWRTHLWDCRWW